MAFIPTDIFFEIIPLMNPLTLSRLSRTSRTLNILCARALSRFRCFYLIGTYLQSHQQLRTLSKTCKAASAALAPLKQHFERYTRSQLDLVRERALATQRASTSDRARVRLEVISRSRALKAAFNALNLKRRGAASFRGRYAFR